MSSNNNEVLEISIQQLVRLIRKLDQEWKERASASYQHHDIAATTVQLWKYQIEEMLRMLYGTDSDSD